MCTIPLESLERCDTVASHGQSICTKLLKKDAGTGNPVLLGEQACVRYSLNSPSFIVGTELVLSAFRRPVDQISGTTRNIVPSRVAA